MPKHSPTTSVLLSLFLSAPNIIKSIPNNMLIILTIIIAKPYPNNMVL
jgi:hypothetical protein